MRSSSAILLATLVALAGCGGPSVVRVPCDAIHPADAKYGQDVCPKR